MSVLWVFLHLLILSWGGYERSDAFFLAVVGASADRSAGRLFGMVGRWCIGFQVFLLVGEIEWRKKNWSGRWVVIAFALGMWLPYENIDGNSVFGLLAGAGYGILSGKKRNSAGAVFYRWLCADSWGTII